MKKEFIKMHGLGNDFAIFDSRKEVLALKPERIRHLANRHTGIGFDQLIVLEKPVSAGADVFMRIYNANGSEVGACGNATRCVAKLHKDRVVIETKAGKISCSAVEGMVCADMGEPYAEWTQIPLAQEEDTDFLPIAEGVLKNPVAVNVGNPHMVFFVEDVEGVPLAELGPQLECHPLFPEHANVEAVQVLSSSILRMRVWERGAGITQACGTGACAAVVAAVRRGLTGRQVKVILDGGELDIEWKESDNRILMTGPAIEVYRGEIEI